MSIINTLEQVITEYKILDDLKPIKNNLKEILAKKNISQAELSNITGISKQSLSAIINNKVIPGLVASSQIALALKLNISDIFELTEDSLVKPAKTPEGLSLYIDLFTLEIINSNEKKSKGILEFIDIKNNKCISWDTIKENNIKNNDYCKRFKKLGTKQSLLYL